MPDSSFVFESGEAISVGRHGEHSYLFASGSEVEDEGESAYVFESGTGLGGGVIESFERTNPLDVYEVIERTSLSSWNILTSGAQDGDKWLEAPAGDSGIIGRKDITVPRPSTTRVYVDPNGGAADPEVVFALQDDDSYLGVRFNNQDTVRLYESGTEVDSASLSASGAASWTLDWKSDDSVDFYHGSTGPVTLQGTADLQDGGIGFADSSPNYNERYDFWRYGDTP